MDEVMRLLIDEHCLIICESVEEKQDLLKQMRDNSFPMSDYCNKVLRGRSMTEDDAFYAHNGRVLFVLQSRAKWRPEEITSDILYKDIYFYTSTPIDHIDIHNLCKLFDEEVASE